MVALDGCAAIVTGASRGIGKGCALDRVTADAAHQLRDHGVTVVSLWPGLVLTERLQQVPRAAPAEARCARLGESAPFCDADSQGR